MDRRLPGEHALGRRVKALGRSVPWRTTRLGTGRGARTETAGTDHAGRPRRPEVRQWARRVWDLSAGRLNVTWDTQGKGPERPMGFWLEQLGELRSSLEGGGRTGQRRASLDLREAHGVLGVLCS